MSKQLVMNFVFQLHKLPKWGGLEAGLQDRSTRCCILQSVEREPPLSPSQASRVVMKEEDQSRNHGIVKYSKAILTNIEMKEHGYEYNSRDHR